LPDYNTFEFIAQYTGISNRLMSCYNAD